MFILEVLRGAKAPAPEDAPQKFKDQKAADVVYLSDKTDLGVYFAVTKGMSNVAQAREAMALFDGTDSSLEAARAAMDGYFRTANDADTGAFLLPLVGIVEDPFAL